MKKFLILALLPLLFSCTPQDNTPTNESFNLSVNGYSDSDAPTLKFYVNQSESQSGNVNVNVDSNTKIYIVAINEINQNTIFDLKVLSKTYRIILNTNLEAGDEIYFTINNNKITQYTNSDNVNFPITELQIQNNLLVIAPTNITKNYFVSSIGTIEGNGNFDLNNSSWSVLNSNGKFYPNVGDFIKVEVNSNFSSNSQPESFKVFVGNKQLQRIATQNSKIWLYKVTE